MFEDILAGLAMVFRFDNMLAALFGVTFGMIMGAIPGLSDIEAIALLIPFTFYLEPVPAISMLVGLSKGANFGGSIPAILFNIPGTAQAFCTGLDGYPLTQQGKSGKALKMALYASVMGDTASDLILFFCAAPVAALALMVGPPEYTMIIFFALVVIAMTGSQDLVKGMIAIGIGLFAALVGLDPETGTRRFTFGSVELSAGLEIVPLCLGLFVISESIKQIEGTITGGRRTDVSMDRLARQSRDPRDHRVSWQELKACLPAILNGIGIGSAIGAIPGLGTTAAAYLSYTRAKKRSKNPERFGQGALEGIAAAESGNNAVNGPNLIPLITLGIPGNLAAALILGAFMMKGLIPGPLFMQQYAPMLYALFIVLFLSNLFALGVGYLFVTWARFLTYFPKAIIYPAVIVLAVVGSYIFRSNIFDIYVMFGFGIVGYLFIRLDIPIPPMLIGYILGGIFETRLRQSLKISGGDVSIFFTHPISLGFFLLTIATVILLLRPKKKA